MLAVFDIGGTNLRAATFYLGVLSNIEIIKTPNYFVYSSEEKINEQIIEIIQSYIIKHKQVKSVGVCFAGPVSKQGVVIGSSVIYGKKLNKPFHLRSKLMKILGMNQIIVVNDLFAAAWRYIGIYKNFLILTISSGIGNKIVVNNEVQIGNEGFEGELGHILAFGCDSIEVTCTCGCGNNHIGAISSGRGIENVANILKNNRFINSYSKSVLYEIESIKADDIAKAADSSADAFALEVIWYCVRPLAYTLCALLTSLYLEKIIIMGGFAQNCISYIEILKKQMIEFGVYNYSSSMISSRVEMGKNDDMHGIWGLVNYSNNYYNRSGIKIIKEVIK